MTFKVMSERCNQCLYGSDKIVSNDRRKELLRELDGRDNYFICHKSTIAGGKVCCRGDFDQRGGGKLGRIAQWLGVVEFVNDSDLKNG
jgi:hypothetical protein